MSEDLVDSIFCCLFKLLCLTRELSTFVNSCSPALWSFALEEGVEKDTQSFEIVSLILSFHVNCQCMPLYVEYPKESHATGSSVLHDSDAMNFIAGFFKLDLSTCSYYLG